MLHRKSILSAAALLALSAAASAQVSLYSFSQSVGTYTPITGGAVLGTATGATGAASLDDVTFGATLPFAFPFDGGTFTQVQMQSNGHIAFGTLTTTSYTPLNTTTANAGYVSACGRDLQAGFTFVGSRTTGSDQLTGVTSIGPMQVGDVLTGTGIPTGTTILAISGSTITMSVPATATSSTASVTAIGPWAEMRFEVVGSAPNQEAVFQWNGFRRFGTGTTVNNGTLLNFQIRLHENGEIRCVYGDCSPGVTGVTTTSVHQVGLRGATNTNFVGRTNTKGVNDDWSLSAPSTTNLQGMLFNAVAPANVIPNGLTYQWTPPVGVFASNTTLGSGCGGQFNSGYALFANSALASAALQGNSLQLINTGAGYVSTWLPGTAAALFVTPVAPTVLPTGDDGEVNVTPSAPLPTPYGPQADLRVSGNGIVGFGNVALTFPGTNSFTPTAGGFLDSNLGGFYAWHDYNELEGGDILSEEIGGVLYITYDNVENYPGAPTVNPGTIQFQLELATGNCTMVFLVVDNNTTSTFGSGHLIGVTAPGVSLNPGSVNLASGFATTTAPEVASLTLAALNEPQQLAGPSTWNLNADNLTAGFGVDVIGFSDPGVLDLSLIGLGQAGCQWRANIDIVNVFATAGGTHAWSLPIPGGAPALNGAQIYVQNAVVDGSLNLSLTKTTNGILGTVGNL